MNNTIECNFENVIIKLIYEDDDIFIFTVNNYNITIKNYKNLFDDEFIYEIYNLDKSVCFSEINDEDLEKLLELKWDMLYLKSIPTDTEIQIYEDELKNYVIKKSEETLFVLTNRGETRLMY